MRFRKGRAYEPSAGKGKRAFARGESELAGGRTIRILDEWGRLR